jgi:hypothetical protein
VSPAAKAAKEAAMQDVSTIPNTVQAHDLHPGDVVRQYDWPLHVREVTLSQAAVTIAVVEFEFPLHYPADAQVRLAP